MEQLYDINYLDVDENVENEKIINKVIKKCFETENLLNSNLYVNIILTTPENIRKFNRQYRNIDNETDVLSFPMFEKGELEEKIEKNDFKNIDVLGDMIISLDRVEKQAKEYSHSFERELAYMVVHSFYHLLGYDHMVEEDKKKMREKEEFVLNILDIKRQ